MSEWIRGVLNAELEILVQKAHRDGYSVARMEASYGYAKNATPAARQATPRRVVSRNT
jgi:hypothetical protein